jgi:gamma-glutamylcyclotransferase (GGCT)/AIG2-like uncharacterized protein YtfP
MHWLFTYGSNMHLKDLQGWLQSSNLPSGEIVQARAGKLIGYRLVWNYYSKVRGGGAANIEPATTDLPGVLLRLDQVALSAIDAKEGHPTHYQRQLASAQLQGGEALRAWTYIVHPERRKPLHIAPTRHYLGLLIDGATAFNLPNAHITALKGLSTID